LHLWAHVVRIPGIRFVNNWTYPLVLVVDEVVIGRLDDARHFVGDVGQQVGVVVSPDEIPDDGLAVHPLFLGPPVEMVVHVLRHPAVFPRSSD
jgi:hypothetical protein